MSACGLIDATLFAGIGLALVGISALTFAGLIRRRGHDETRRALGHRIAALHIITLASAGQFDEAQALARDHNIYRDFDA